MEKTKRILIAEDEQQLRLVAELLLESHGYKVVVSRDGLDAIDKVRMANSENYNFDLIITDVMMPFLSGLDLFDQLRSEGIDIPFLFITGYGDRNLFAEFKRRRIQEWLEKPFKPTDLMEKVNSLVNGSSAGKH